MKKYLLIPSLMVVLIYATSCIKTDPSPSSSSTTTNTGNGSVSTGNSNNATNWTVNGITYTANSGNPAWLTSSGVFEMIANATGTSTENTSESFLYFASNNPPSGTYTLVNSNYSTSSLAANQAYFYVATHKSSNNYSASFINPNTTNGFANVTNNSGSLTVTISNVKMYGLSSYTASSGGTVANYSDSTIVSGTFVK